jgi:hypothetical protein
MDTRQKQIDFFNLPLAQRLRKLYMEGEFIVSIRYYGYKVNLYLLYDFYVEVFYHHLQDKIEKVLLLDPKCTRMKFYTDQMDLAEDGPKQK